MLKLADLVRVERRGQFQVYSLNTTVFQDLLAELMEPNLEVVGMAGVVEEALATSAS